MLEHMHGGDTEAGETLGEPDYHPTWVYFI